MGIEGVTECPDCGSALSPTDSDDNRPVQSVDQTCADCSYETTIALLWYQSDHEIVADVADIHDEKATVVISRGLCEDPTYYGADETRAHHQTALDVATS